MMKKILLLSILSTTLMQLTAQPADTLQLLKLKAPDTYCVNVQTDMGDMIVEVNKAWASVAADRFYQLVTSGFFTNSRFFRSNKKYLQFGISGDSAVNAFWERHPLKDEPVNLKNTTGTISFAMGGPNTRTSSVYFNKTDNPKLDTIQNSTGFPAFGKIVSGDSLLALFENKYVDSVVFKEWDAMVAKGNTYTDRVMTGLRRIIRMEIVACKPGEKKKVTSVTGK
jgi:peptidyl-prolyl cis-trans isomerase A (cyclophilin A)